MNYLVSYDMSNNKNRKKNLRLFIGKRLFENTKICISRRNSKD